MTRPEAPKEVELYWLWQKEGPPKCCHTCDHYLGNGTCDKHKMRPPDEFTQTIGACGDYECLIPF